MFAIIRELSPITSEDTILDANTYAITLLYLIASIVSVLFSGISIFLYIKYASLDHNYAAKLIVLLSIADICGWTPGIITAFETLLTQKTQNQFNGASCIFLAVWKTFFNNMTNVCVLLIGFFLFLNVYLGKNPHDFQKVVYFLSLLIVIILTVIPGITNDYGDVDGSTCWIQGYYMRLGVFYLPLLIMLVLDFIFISITINKINKLQLMAEYQRKLIVKFISFPIIMFICWGPGTLKRLLDNSVNADSLLFLKYLMYILMPLQGVFNPLAYLFINDTLRYKILSFFKMEKFTRPSNENIDGEALLIEQEMQLNDDSSSRSL